MLNTAVRTANLINTSGHSHRTHLMRWRRAPNPKHVRPMFPVLAGIRGRKSTTCNMGISLLCAHAMCATQYHRCAIHDISSYLPPCPNSSSAAYCWIPPITAAADLYQVTSTESLRIIHHTLFFFFRQQTSSFQCYRSRRHLIFDFEAPAPMGILNYEFWIPFNWLLPFCCPYS